MGSRQDGKPKERPKLTAQPTKFFDILSESDVQKRREKIGDLQDSGLQDNNLSPVEVVNILQCLAGDDYIDKSHISIQKKLGEGGFATVERALLSVPGKPNETVAIKTLKVGLLKDEEDLRELIQEANLLRKLEHRYIVNFKGIGCRDTSSVSGMRNSVFFGEEYMRGGSLKGRVAHQMKARSVQVYRAEDAWRWCYQMAEALVYLHHCNPVVVHRDLKPENVLLTSKNPAMSEARIADFGLHKRINRVRMARVKSVRTMNQAQLTLESDVTHSTPDLCRKPESEEQKAPEQSSNPDKDDTRRQVKWKDQSTSISGGYETFQSGQDEQDASMASDAHLGVGGEGFNSLGEGSSPGVDMDVLVNKDAGRGDELKDVAPSDDDVGISGLKENLPTDGAVEDFNSATGTASMPKRHTILNAVDSLVVARKHKNHEAQKEGLLENQQRGSSQALNSLDENLSSSDAPDGYSSVMHSLGLSGTGHLSGMVGSLLYMAPEVVRGEEYTEKIDVFAFALIMFELFLGRLMVAQVLAGVFFPKEMERELQRHALKTAAGHRPTIPEKWPKQLRSLIADCWDHDPGKRPAMSKVVKRLQEMKENGTISEMEELFQAQLARQGGQRRCCIIV